jgi:hypothetical protein
LTDNNRLQGIHILKERKLKYEKKVVSCIVLGIRA